MCIYTTTPPWTEFDTRSIFKQSKAVLNSEFSFPRLVAKTSSQSAQLYTNSKGEKHIHAFLSKVELQTVSSRI